MPVKILSGLSDWQIVQQGSDGFADIRVSGTWSRPAGKPSHDVYVRVVREEDLSPVTRALDWHAVETDTNGTWNAALRVPAGGLYHLETLLRRRGLRIDWNSKGECVSHFGVGDIWVIAGQSNADGNGRSDAFDPPEPGVHVFRHSGEWGLACHPLHDGTRSKYTAEYMTANHSPWLAFAKKVRARTGLPIGLVPAAQGGSGIAQWLPEKKGELFRSMERICDDACARRVKGVLWYQGCTDTLTPEGTNYYPHLASFIRQTRAAFHDPALPILSVQINRVSNHPAGFWTPPRWDVIREAQRRATREFANHWLVSSMDCIFDDCIHNSSESNIRLGRRVADLALGKVYGQDVACLCPDAREAVRSADGLSVTVTFDNVTGEMVSEPRDPALFPFLLKDEAGEVPLKAVESKVNDTLVLKLGRALKGKATLVGCPGTYPFIGVPHDMPGYRPMLAFTVEVAEPKTEAAKVAAVAVPLWVNVAPLPANPAQAQQIADDQRWLFDHTPMDSVGYCCTLVPEATPAFDKAAVLAPRFREQKRRLAGARGRVGYLFQATMGHGWTPDSESPFTRLVKGDGSVPYIFCPLDLEFLAYIRRQSATLVAEKPDFVMVDDDTRMYTSRNACYCKLHLDEFARRTGRRFTRESLQTEMKTNSVLNAQWDLLLRDSIAGLMKVIREEMDKVDPLMPGLFCCCGDDVHHAGYMAKVLAAPGQQPVVRLNNGRYCSELARDYAGWLGRTAVEIAVLKSEGCLVLDEPDTCPQNRYSMSAADLLAHVSLALLEGCDGGKFWITRMSGNEPASGLAYRDVLATNAGFLRKIRELAPTWEGVGIPLARPPYTHASIQNWTINWGGNLFGRLGIPYVNSTKVQPVNALASTPVEQPILSDVQIRELLAGKLLIDGKTALVLAQKGYAKFLGFTPTPWSGPVASYEKCETVPAIGGFYEPVKFTALAKGARARSDYRHRSAALSDESESVGPGIVDFTNDAGGRILSFASTFPPWLNHSWFGFYNESRKRQLVGLLTELYGGKLPFAYYPGDGEVLIKWGRAKDGTQLMAVFVSGHDDLERLPVVFPSAPSGIRRLMPDGSWRPVGFRREANGVTILDATVRFLHPEIFVID